MTFQIRFFSSVYYKMEDYTYPGDTHANLSQILASLSWLIRSQPVIVGERAKIRGLRVYFQLFSYILMMIMNTAVAYYDRRTCLS